MMFHLSAAILDTSERRPRSIAIVAPDRVIDYGTFGRAVLGLTAALVAAGVRPGDAVGLLVTDVPEDLTALFALYRLGAPAIFASRWESVDERRALLRRVGARFTIGPEAYRADDGTRYVTHESLATESLATAAAPARLPPPPHPTAVAYFNRSSGTTLGQVKLVGITHAQRGAREAILDAVFPRGPDDRHIHLMTLANSFARSAATTVLQGGGTLVMPPRLGDIASLRRFVRSAGITVAALSPPFVRDILRGAPEEPVLPGVRLLLGTAALTTAERRQVLAHVAPLAHIGYSTNEAGYLALAGPADLAVDIESVGRVLPGIEAEVVDDGLDPQPPGTTGELRFRHPDFPAGYVDPVPGSTSRFRDGWFYPGDAGAISADGRITLKGRIDDVINVGGRKVHPTAIEAWLDEHPDVAEVAVVAFPSGRTGQVPVAAVVLSRPVAEADLIAFCRSRSGGLPMPARILAVSALPRNAAGKVDRTALIDRLRSGHRS